MEPLLPDNDDPEDLREILDEGLAGVGGNGFSNSLPNSLKTLSNPGCICLAIIGKLLSRSLNDLMSFFRGMPEELSLGSRNKVLLVGVGDERIPA